MDPSRKICLIEDSFKREKIDETVKFYTSEIGIGSPRTRRKKLLENGKNYPNFYKDFRKIDEKVANPFSNYSSKVFDKSSLILANIDAVYNFSGQEDGYLNPQIIKEYDYGDLSGNYLVYLQYRLPISIGFTICQKEKNKKLDYRQINLTCDDYSFTNYVLEILPEGLDLVISSKINYKDNLLKALKICKKGGTFVSRIDEKINDIELFYITSLCFDKFSIFKPFSENLNENYSYVVAQEYKGNCSDWIEVLEKGGEMNIPTSFLIYVQSYHQKLFDLRKRLLEKPESYNTYRALAIWNIF